MRLRKFSSTTGKLSTKEILTSSVVFVVGFVWIFFSGKLWLSVVNCV